MYCTPSISFNLKNAGQRIQSLADLCCAVKATLFSKDIPITYTEDWESHDVAFPHAFEIMLCHAN